MTDEHKNNNNINSNKISSTNNSNNSHPNNENNNNERIIAEAAAKFLLKNGLNGNQFQLPPPPPASSPSTLRPSSSSSISSSSASASVSTLATTSALVATNGFLPHVSTTPTTKATKSSSPRPSPAPATASTSSSSAATAAAAAAGMAASAAMVAAATAAAASTTAVPKPVDIIGGVLDYSSLGQVQSSTVKTGKNSNSNSSSSSGFDMGRHPISTPINATNNNYGGRLQFFKNGKFILELARSKDSDRGGWVSVPRKAFRPPSAATSATVTPTSAVTTTYPKNENSTSLSFSDDNSSIQSSPWQRDQPWKQSRPRRGISKELTLYYHRPRQNILSKKGLQLAARKRRRPHEPIASEEEQKAIFECIKLEENGDETLKPEKLESITHIDKDVGQGPKAAAAPSTTASVAEANASAHDNDDDDDKIKVDKQQTIKDGIKEEEEDSKTELKDAAASQTTEAIDSTCIAEKMNTSEDEEAMLVVNNSDEALPDAAVPVSTSSSGSNLTSVNGNNGELNGDAISEPRTTDIRLKKRKPRAKLTNIIQKLIDGVPARLEQLSKTSAVMASLVTGTERSVGGAISSLSHSLTHKVSPPSSAATASRLVEYHHQHVSPRKRILREFEKVSLEDNGCINNGSGSSATSSSGGISGGVGGKRSRAKACTPSAKSAPINLAPPQAKTPTAPTTNAPPAAQQQQQQQQPTRLNSSYSIHSLLGGSSSSGSTKGSSSDHPAAIISNVHHHHHPNPHSLYGTSAASYPRALLGSPKSPDMGAGSNGSGGGGKSPSHVATKKRSPPYTATGSPLPIDYAHTHSFYAPYAAPGTGASPRTSTSGSATVSSHIPHGVSSSTSRDLSPARSSTASPATTPRTVPKKTASIRREFASPTASNSCPSPGERSASPPDRRHMHLQRNSPAAGSPLHYYMYPPPPQVNGTSSTAGTSSPSQSVSAASSTSAAMAAAAAAAAYIPSVVSPSLYHPYISTLAAMRHNPMWIHYQTGAAAPMLVPPPPPPPHSHQATSQVAAAAASRLSPSSPYHAFAYNGVGAAAVAAAAAAVFGQPAPSPHTHPHLAHPTALAHMATPKLTDSSTDQMSAATSHRTASTSPASSNASVSSTVASGASTSSAMFHNSNLRNEPSSDLPLNLSKH